MAKYFLLILLIIRYLPLNAIETGEMEIIAKQFTHDKENKRIFATGDVELVDEKFKIHGFNGAGTNRRITWAPLIRSPSAIDYDAVTWKTSDGTSSWANTGAKSTGDVDTTTDEEFSVPSKQFVRDFCDSYGNVNYDGLTKLGSNSKLL